MQFHETILCTTAPQTAGTGPGAIAIHDIQTGSSLATFKQTSAINHSTAVIESRDGQGGFMLAAQPDKSILNVYNFQKEQMALKIVLPEKLSCIAVDPRGDFCAGGAAQGRIYMWEIASGILYNSWDAHYRQVNVLRFTHDGAALISGSEDSGVSVWSVSRLLDDDIQNDLPVPYCTLSDHTLPITDIVIGVGLFPTCRVLTSSVDHSVKIWDLSSKSLLTTFQFPNAIGCLVWDVAERMFFAGSSSSTAEGSIHQVNLFRQRDDKSAASMAEAIGGAGAGDVVRIGNDNPSVNNKKRLISVGLPITCLALSLPSSLLLVGTSAGLINIYDTASHQQLRTISTHKGFTISHLSTMLKPPDLIGHVSLNLSVGNGIDMKDVLPMRVVAAFQRMRDAKAREKHEVEMLLPIQDHTYLDDIYSKEELLRDHAYFVQLSQATSSSSQTSNAPLQTRVIALESEIDELKEQLRKAKGLNDVMWENVVQKVLKGDSAKAASNVGDGGGEGGMRRKRGRIE